MSKKRKNKALQKKSPNRKPPGITRNQIQAQLTSEHFSGPLPPPEILSAYDHIQTGFAERIVKMAEKEQQYVIEMNKMAHLSSAREVRRGQVFALIVTLAAFSAASFMAYCGAEQAAMVVGGTTIVGLVLAFITGRKKTPKNNSVID